MHQVNPDSSKLDVAQPRPPRRDPALLFALFVAFILHPLIYTLLVPGFLHAAFGKPHDNPTGRADWWLTTGWIFLFEWLPFLVVWWAVRRGKHNWQEVAGVDWGFFKRHRVVFLSATALLVLVAVLVPIFSPRDAHSSTAFPFQPLGGSERLMFLALSVSAGVCEEISYRGLPLRLLASSAPRAWLVLPLTMIAFVFNHGRMGPRTFSYLTFGFMFGTVFILVGRRRLEWLIVAHALFDAALVVFNA